MHCTGCFNEIEVSNKTYATAIGSIEQNPFTEKGECGFYTSECEPWIIVLCKDCGSAMHDFINKQLQAKHL